MLQRHELHYPEFPLPANKTVRYGFDWNKLLLGESILTSVWVVDNPAVTLASPKNLNGVTTTNADGGSVGQSYKLTNTITTATRSESRSLLLFCKVS